jgi:hypothetical protein
MTKMDLDVGLSRNAEPIPISCNRNNIISKSEICLIAEKVALALCEGEIVSLV